MDYKLPIWRFLPLKGVEKRLRLCPGCVASLQHQPVSACRGEQQQRWEGVGGYIKRWNAASAAKLHPIEYDFVSVARSNTLSTYIMFTVVSACMSKNTLPLKNCLLSAVSAVIQVNTNKLKVRCFGYFMPVNVCFATRWYHLLYHNMNQISYSRLHLKQTSLYHVRKLLLNSSTQRWGIIKRGEAQ